MKAIGFFTPSPIAATESLIDLDVPEPTLRDHDLLVEVKAISVNPVDVKIRAGSTPPEGQPRILGWDASGIVKAVGPKVSRFKEGDRVWYAGDITRPGSNAQWQAVDERVVGPMPRSLDFAQAAALPLTAITAWELLFDRLKVQHANPAANGVLLIIGAAGGVGSILIQLARALTGLTVIGTASRPTSRDWVRASGAHHVIDYSLPWGPQLKDIGLHQVSHVIGLNHTERYLSQIVDVLQAEGQLALIDDPQSLDIRPFKAKSLSVHWELMFTRTMYQTPTQTGQHELLRRVAELVDQGVVKTTMTERIAGINAANLKIAHAMIETGSTIGKVVLEGF